LTEGEPVLNSYKVVLIKPESGIVSAADLPLMDCRPGEKSTLFGQNQRIGD
jgi:hypothetical protein